MGETGQWGNEYDGSGGRTDVCCQMAAQRLGSNAYRNRKEPDRVQEGIENRDRDTEMRLKRETERRKSEIPLNPIRCRRA